MRSAGFMSSQIIRQYNLKSVVSRNITSHRLAIKSTNAQPMKTIYRNFAEVAKNQPIAPPPPPNNLLFRQIAIFLIGTSILTYAYFLKGDDETEALIAAIVNTTHNPNPTTESVDKDELDKAPNTDTAKN